MAKLYIDFETRSAVDLPKAGVHRYAEHWSTDILCLGFAFDDDIPRWGVPIAGNLFSEAMRAVKGGIKVVAHNAPFELALWNTVGQRKYKYPELKPEQVSCTMARAYAMGLPGSLEKASASVGLSMQKDMRGHRLMMKLSRPRKILPDARILWWGTEEEFVRLGEYCCQDVEVERGLDKRLLSLTPRETQLWLLDQKINNAGIAVDLKAARTAIEVVEIEKKRLNAELQEVSGNQIATYNAHAQVKRFIIDSGIQTSGVAKAEVSGLLERADLPAKVRRVLEIRQEAAKSSNKKLQSFVAGCNLDGRMRGIFQYHGAGTGRWAGRRVQPQNFPRPKIKQFDIEEIFGVLRKGDAKLALDFITVFHGSPMSIISQCLRGFMCGGVEQVLCAMDFIAVEARVLAWLAGEESVLEVFRTHGLIYEKTACDIYGIPMDMHMAKDDPRRQVGKVSDLALGFQGGVGALQKMAKTLGIKMAPALQGLWERAAGNVRERAMQRWAKEKKKALAAGISKYEWLASELTKVAWRAAHPEIVRYWSDVEEAALRAVKNPGEKCYAGVPGRGVTYLKRGSFLFCRLPSGRNLCYPYPKLEEIETPWGAKKTALTYMAENSTTKKWERQKAYGGLLVENNTQAVARDLLADAMLRLDAQNFRIVLHVHDEVVVELPQFFEASITVKGIERIVSQVPEWAAGLPLAAEGWAGKRYRK